MRISLQIEMNLHEAVLQDFIMNLLKMAKTATNITNSKNWTPSSSCFVWAAGPRAASFRPEITVELKKQLWARELDSYSS